MCLVVVVVCLCVWRGVGGGGVGREASCIDMPVVIGKRLSHTGRAVSGCMFQPLIRALVVL